MFLTQIFCVRVYKSIKTRTESFVSLERADMGVVVYFNQPMGAAQPVGWSIYVFLLLFPFLKVLHDFDSKMGKMDKKYCSQMLVHTNACLTPCNRPRMRECLLGLCNS